MLAVTFNVRLFMFEKGQYYYNDYDYDDYDYYYYYSIIIVTSQIFKPRWLLTGISRL